MATLDDVQLPPDDANKTAELGADDDQSTPTADATVPDDKKTEPDTRDTAPDSSSDGGGTDDNTDVKPDSKPTPFHEHPDWKKMVDERAADRERIARLEGELAASKRTPEAVSVDPDTSSPVAMSKEAVAKKLKDGWKPEDQLEINEVYLDEYDKANKLIAKAREAKKAELQEKLSKEEATIKTQVNDVFVKAGVSKPDDRKLVHEQVQKWVDEGAAIWSVATIATAIEYLKATGKVGKSETSESSKTTPDPDKTKRDEVNNRIVRPKGSGESSSGSKTHIAKAGMRLDDVVQKLKETLE